MLITVLLVSSFIALINAPCVERRWQETHESKVKYCADSMLCYCQRSKSFLQVLHERDESVRESIVSSEPVTHVDSLWPQFAAN